MSDEEHSNEEALGTVPKIEPSTTSSSISTKSKRTSKATKPAPKPMPPKEKKSARRDYSKDVAPKEKKKNNAHSTKCPFAVDHKKNGIRGLSEEQIIGNLDSGYLLGASCSVCNKVIVNKNNLTDEEKATETMFNRKLLLLTCDNFRAANDVYCRFCMCGQCYRDIYINDEKSADKGARRSRRNME